MSAKQLQALVEEFNRRYPIGAPVWLRKDTETIATRVRGAACVLGGHSAVAWFEGVSGAYSIEDDRVSPRPLVQDAAA